KKKKKKSNKKKADNHSSNDDKKKNKHANKKHTSSKYEEKDKLNILSKKDDINNKQKIKKELNKNETNKTKDIKNKTKQKETENENKNSDDDKEEKKKESKGSEERRVYIHLESPLSILTCGGLISSKKLIEAQTVLIENNKRLEKAKNNCSVNNTKTKDVDNNSCEKEEKEHNKKNKKKTNSFLFSNSLAVEVDLSSCFFFHSSFTCPISRDRSTKTNPPYLLTCGHAICKNCLDKIHIQKSRQFKCPMCPKYLFLSDVIPLKFN
ncbi:zinc finger, C3HC4 type, putative, partial [Hepatocystis sp. ex Piliocolobus tephrosceles]